MPRREGRKEDLFEGDFSAIMDATENALQSTRATQRQSWRTAAGESSLPPYGVDDALLERLHYESIVQDTERQVNEESSTLSLDFRGGSGKGTGNPLAVVSVGNENVVVCALSGLLDSAGVYNVTTTEEDEEMRQCIRRKGGHAPPCDVIINDVSPVTNIVASKWENGDAEPCRAVFVTSRSLNFAHLCTEQTQPTVNWDDTIPFPDALSVALNPLYPSEFAAVCADGLFFGTTSEFALRQRGEECFHDVQAVEHRAIYNRICYGQHPRTLLLACRNDVASFDMRAPVCKGSGAVLFDVRHHWNLPRYDSGISVFHLMQTRGYTALVATQSCLNYVDLRMPHHPLLDWSMVMPRPVDLSCVASVHKGGTRSEMIALWSRSQCYLEVYHAIHGERPPSPDFHLDSIAIVKGGRMKGSEQWAPPPVARRSILWSDLPLSHLQQLSGCSKISGMALLPLNDGNQVSLLQWSATDGLIGQLLDIRVGDDAEDFEADPEDGFTDENLLRMQEFQYRLVDCGEYRGVKSMEDPVAYSLPGREMVKTVKPLKVSNILELRKRILRDTDDDVNETETVRFPRPFLADIPTIQKLRHQSGDRRVAENKDREDNIENKTKRLIRSNVGAMAIANPLFPVTNVKDDESKSSSATTERPASVGDAHELGNEAQMLDDSNPSTATVTCGQRATHIPFLGSSEGSDDLLDTENEEKSEMDGLLEEIGFGKTLDEIARIVRHGMPHNATPLGVDELRASLESSPSVKWRDVGWHNQCKTDHSGDPTVVSTNGPLPDWVHRRVYYTKEVPSPEQVIEDLDVDKESEFGQVLIRVKNLFFDDVEIVDGSRSPLKFVAASQGD